MSLADRAPTSIAKTDWRLVILLYGTGLLAAFQYAKIPYMLPGLLVLTPMSALAQAILLSVIGTVGALAGTFAGAICQAFGLRRTLLTGLMLGVAGAALPLLVHGHGMLLMARLVESVAHMAIVVAVPTLMLSLSSPADRPRVMALWSCYFTMTFIIAAAIAQPLLALGGWQAFAIVHVLLLLLALGLCSLKPMVDAAGDQGAKASAGQTNAPSVRSVLDAQIRLLQGAKLLAVPATFFGYTLLFVALVSVLPGLTTDTPQQRFILAMLLPGASLVGTAISMLALGRGVAGHRLVRFAALAILASGLALVLLHSGGIAIHSDTTRAVVLATFIFLGMLPAGIFSSIPALFKANDPDIALVNGGVVQFGNLGNFLGSPILALLLVNWGWVSIGLYLGLGASVVLVCLAFLKRHVSG